MVFKPNYRQQRIERDREVRTKRAEKLKNLQERSDQRKAERAHLTPSVEERDQDVD